MEQVLQPPRQGAKVFSPMAGAFPLAVAGYGSRVRVCGAKGNAETARFLERLGFVPGADAAVVCAAGGDLIVDIKGARVALGRQLASKIWVRCEENG